MESSASSATRQDTMRGTALPKILTGPQQNCLVRPAWQCWFRIAAALCIYVLYGCSFTASTVLPAKTVLWLCEKIELPQVIAYSEMHELDGLNLGMMELHLLHHHRVLLGVA